ncbi:MAG: delta-aminolevulinic acid dehydratase [Actinobacteria bacterium]|nr:MAG: delta-aminolevulinic acid dehydratase [Actinomycetota bacterium]
MKLSRMVEQALGKLLAYCEARGWQGYDPYDGLNSRLLGLLPFGGRTIRLAVIQSMKRSPINLRPLLRVPEGRNPKALALFLSAYSRLHRSDPEAGYDTRCRRLTGMLDEDVTPGYSGPAWGYNFDWQSRTSFVPAGTPNSVCTVFVAEAFLDAYEALGDSRYLELARAGCDFLLGDINRTSDETGSCFSYTPIDSTQVYNVSLLVAALLARTYAYTGESALLGVAREASRWAVARQNDDGSWYYSPLPWHQWIDNIHTGFNLTALADLAAYSRDDSLDGPLARGLDYYSRNLFEGAVPKYHNNRLYPIDVHSAAVAIVTLLRLAGFDDENRSRAWRVAEWTTRMMQDPGGFFYYQRNRRYANKISYMRWSQAWMCYALAHLLTTPRLTAPAARYRRRKGEQVITDAATPDVSADEMTG